MLLVLATLAIWLAYFTNWHSSAPNGSLRDALLRHPLAVLAYALLYIGSPATWSGLGTKSGFVWGAVLLFGLAYSTWLALSRRAVSSSALLAMSVFVYGNAFITAAGRLEFGLETATLSRYTTAPLVMTASLVIFLWLNENRPGRRKWIAGLFAMAPALVVVAQRTVFHSAHGALYAKRIAGLALRAHVYETTYTRVLYPNAGGLKSLAIAAETMGLSTFCAKPNRFRRTSADDFRDRALCRGDRQHHSHRDARPVRCHWLDVRYAGQTLRRLDRNCGHER
ncbi:hypothetical protein [Paraburkholderia tropica]|uniref:hypothetical protein n=1 Tax=Paraburkholderia tropica TaxID=92647 RepID=UPI003D29D275